MASFIVFGATFNYTEGLVILGAIFLLCGILEAVQLPIYFKIGYAKAKFLVYVPLFVPMSITILLSIFFKDSDLTGIIINLWGYITANPAVTAVIFIGIWLASLGVSYKISLAFYKKRDF